MAIKQPSAPFANDMFLKNMFNERLFENYSLFSELQRKTKGKLWLYKQLFAQIPLIRHPQGYWQLALFSCHFAYQAEMITNLISLGGYLG